jgi:acyl carrier protein
MADATILTLEEFRRFLAETTGMREEFLTPESSLLNDLAIDSLKLVELILQFELQLGVSVPTVAAWDIETVADAYRFYVEQHRTRVIAQ